MYVCVCVCVCVCARVCVSLGHVLSLQCGTHSPLLELAIPPDSGATQNKQQEIKIVLVDLANGGHLRLGSQYVHKR